MSRVEMSRVEMSRVEMSGSDDRKAHAALAHTAGSPLLQQSEPRMPDGGGPARRRRSILQ